MDLTTSGTIKTGRAPVAIMIPDPVSDDDAASYSLLNAVANEYWFPEDVINGSIDTDGMPPGSQAHPPELSPTQTWNLPDEKTRVPPPSRQCKACIQATVRDGPRTRAEARGQSTKRKPATTSQGEPATRAEGKARARAATKQNGVLVARSQEIPGQPDHTEDVFRVKRILGRYRHLIFLRWDDGTTGLVRKRDVLDKDMLNEFQEGYEGLDAGVDILESRGKGGNRQCKVHWRGLSRHQDVWVGEGLIAKKRRTKEIPSYWKEPKSN